MRQESLDSHCDIRCGARLELNGDEERKCHSFLFLSASITLIYFNGHVDLIVTRRSAQTHTQHITFILSILGKMKRQKCWKEKRLQKLSRFFSLFLIRDFYRLLCCAHSTIYFPPTITIVCLIGAGKRFSFLLCFLMMEQFPLSSKPKAERIQFDNKVWWKGRKKNFLTIVEIFQQQYISVWAPLISFQIV